MIQYKTNPVKAIREKCLDCCCGSTSEVANCSVERCPLFPFRYGKNPYRQSRVFTEEQREVMRHRMEVCRKSLSSSKEKSEGEGEDE